MFHDQWDIINRYKVYAANNNVIPLKFEKPEDLIAYYPYIVAMSYGNKDGTGAIHLSGKSYIDAEEEDSLKWKMDHVKLVYRRCKRNHIPFDRKVAEQEISWRDELLPYEVEIIDRVERDGNKATTKGIHDPMHERMRDEWYKLMVDNGWDEHTAYIWVYGWDRYLSSHKKEGYGNMTTQQTLDFGENENESNSKG